MLGDKRFISLPLFTIGISIVIILFGGYLSYVNAIELPGDSISTIISAILFGLLICVFIQIQTAQKTTSMHLIAGFVVLSLLCMEIITRLLSVGREYKPLASTTIEDNRYVLSVSSDGSNSYYFSLHRCNASGLFCEGVYSSNLDCWKTPIPCIAVPAQYYYAPVENVTSVTRLIPDLNRQIIHIEVGGEVSRSYSYAETGTQ